MEVNARALVASRRLAPQPRRVARLVVLVAVVMTVAPTASAQERGDDGRPWYVSVSRWGRWIALAGAAGFTTLAVVRNNDANEIFDGLVALCRNASQACMLGANGQYIDAGAEALYQETLRLDSRARSWTAVGQVALVAAGGMFLIDLVWGGSEPENIPFAPLEVFAHPGKLGLQIRF